MSLRHRCRRAAPEGAPSQAVERRVVVAAGHRAVAGCWVEVVVRCWVEVAVVVRCWEVAVVVAGCWMVLGQYVAAARAG